MRVKTLLVCLLPAMLALSSGAQNTQTVDFPKLQNSDFANSTQWRPFSSYYKFHVTCNFYRPADLNNISGDIQSVGYYLQEVKSPKPNTIKMYMGHWKDVSNATVSKLTPNDLIKSGQLVYSGRMEANAFRAHDYCMVNLQSSFHYNGKDNLFVIIITGIDPRDQKPLSDAIDDKNFLSFDPKFSSIPSRYLISYKSEEEMLGRVWGGTMRQGYARFQFGNAVAGQTPHLDSAVVPPPVVVTPPPGPVSDIPRNPRQADALALNGWDFEEGRNALSLWTKTGTAFNNQPTYGNNVTVHREIRNANTPFPFTMPLGGDYWANVSFPIGHQGNFWLGTYENRPGWRDPFGSMQGDIPTGSITSQAFKVTKKFISFLIGGTNDIANCKIELLLRDSAVGTETFPDGKYLLAHAKSTLTIRNPTALAPPLVATGNNAETMNRSWWNVEHLAGKTVRVRISDLSNSGHINIDDIRFLDISPDQEEWTLTGTIHGKRLFSKNGKWYEYNLPVWGVTDLHTHLMGDKAFGGKIFSGTVAGNIETALHECSRDHGTPFNNANEGDVIRNMMVDKMGEGVVSKFGLVPTGWFHDELRKYSTTHTIKIPDAYKSIGKDEKDLPELYPRLTSLISRYNIGNNQVYNIDRSTDQGRQDANDLYKYFFESKHQDFHYQGFESHDRGVNNFINFPAFNNTTHQAMWHGFLERAYQGGLRVIVALAHHNQMLAYPSNGSDTKDLDDDDALNIQIQAIKDFATANPGRYGIALTPLDVRDIVRSGRMAIILGSEIDHPGDFYHPSFKRSTGDPRNEKYHANPSVDEVQACIDRLWDMGIRYIFPIHLSDNIIGGSAVYSGDFNSGNKFYNQRDFDVITASPADSIYFHTNSVGDDLEGWITQIVVSKNDINGDVIKSKNFDEVPHGQKNIYGLNVMGYKMISMMMKKGMMIDIDHMSDQAVTDLIPFAQRNQYPLNSGHNSFRIINYTPSENNRSYVQAQALQQLGGLFGVGWGCADYKSAVDAAPGSLYFNSRVDNNAAGSSKTFAQNYLYALHMYQGKNVMLGSDINSFVVAPAPRFGTYANYGLDISRIMMKSLYNSQQTNPVKYSTTFPGVSLGGPLTTVEAMRSANTPLVRSSCAYKSWDYNTDGLAHYGMVPDFLQDLKNINVTDNDLSPLFLSAEYFTEMWEKCLSRSEHISTDITGDGSTLVFADDLFDLCPHHHVAGDREFDGNGPHIVCTVSLSINSDRTQLMANIQFDAKETAGDHSEVDGSWSVAIYTAPAGATIDRIISDQNARCDFVSTHGGGEVGSSGDGDVNIPPITGALVQRFEIIGDTGGDDISDDNNCSGDTKIKRIHFYPIRVALRFR